MGAAALAAAADAVCDCCRGDFTHPRGVGMADNGQSETHAWVASKTVDGEWHRARVVSQQDGQATLVTLDTEETHTVSSDVSAPLFRTFRL